MTQTHNLEHLTTQLLASRDGRESQAAILQKIAEFGHDGCWPNDVTPEQVGRAFYRIAMNAPGEDPLARFIAGYREAQQRHEAFETTLNQDLPR
jgi:hypothetical protein